MIARNWEGETAFIIGGGPSVLTQPIDRLRGRKVIVINSSFERAPWASILFFHDDRWWRKYMDKVLAVFAGTICTTCSARHARIAHLKNIRPSRTKGGQVQNPPTPLQLSTDPSAVPMRRTSVVPALNIAVLKGVKAIVTLGLDGKMGPDGQRNHYAVQYSAHGWRHAPSTWERHQADIEPLVPQIAAAGITVTNASPGSAWPFWPITSLDEFLNAEATC
jgi:hypothetical protein